MIVLGLDGSVGGPGVALADEAGLRAACWAGPGSRPAGTLLALAERALATEGLCPGDIGGVAVAVGPGSYAGVRAAVMTAKALAHAAGWPLVAIGSLEALARGVGPWPGPVWTALDARRDRRYAAAFRWDAGGGLLPDGEPTLWGRDALRRAAAAASGGPLLLAGTGWDEDDRSALASERAEGAWLGPPTAAPALAPAVALRGRQLLLGGVTTDPLALAPLYVGEPVIGRPAADVRAGGARPG